MTNGKSLDNLSPAARRALLERALRKKAEQTRTGALSFGQRALWFVQKLAEDSVAHVAPLSVRVRSEVDVPTLRRAAKSLLARHAALRTMFTTRDGEPIAVIREGLEPELTQERMEGASDDAIVERLLREVHRPFNLERPPLFRVLLVTRSPREHVLLLTAHHIAIDLWSLMVMVEELAALYSAELSATPASLMPLPLEYLDYVRDEQAVLNERGEDLLTYWRERLAGPLPELALKSDYPRAKVRAFRGANVTFTLPSELTRALRELAKQESTTLNTVLMAVFQVLLQRSSGQDDIIVGSPTSGRERPELSGVVGYLVNPIAIRGDLSGSPSFRVFLRQVRQRVLEAMQHRGYPFPLLVEKLQPPRDPSRSPIFQAWFVLQQVQRLDGAFATLFGIPGANTVLGGLVLEAFPLPRRTSQFDLELMMTAHDGGLFGSFQYDSDLFAAKSIERLTDRFEVLLQGIVRDPDESILRLPFLSAAETSRLREFNETAAEGLGDLCLHQAFERHVASAPESLAVLCGPDRLTYGELNRRANQLAQRLRSLGIGPEERVAICVERSLQMVVGVLGILKAGGAYVPLDPSYPSERLRFMLQHCDARVLVTEHRFADALLSPNTRTLCLDTEQAALSKEPETNPVTGVTSRNLAYIIYTSGSTGQPKGVMIEHRGPLNTIWDINRRLGVGAGDRTLALSSLSFDLSVYDIFGMLTAGGAVVVPEPQGAREPAYWARVAEQATVTVWNSVPALMDMLVSHCEGRPELFPTSLRLVLMSGDFLPLALPDSIRRLSPSTRVVNWGGATETSINSSFFPIETVQPEWESIPYGCPLANQSLYVLNDALDPCAIGVKGMLWVGGHGVARGYFRDDEKTNASFVVHPRTGERLYRTGDLARYRDYDCVELVGRADSQVKIRGYRIELGEIEAALSRHPGLSGAVLVASEPGASAGSHDKRLIAYARAARTSAPSTEELRAFLRERLPEYMVPGVFVWLDAFPLSQNGKVDRKALPAPSLERASPSGQASSGDSPGDLASVLVDIWKELLGLQVVGLDDNFFDLGGHSLLMARVQSRLASALGRDVAIVDLFAHPTIRALARFLEPKRYTCATSSDAHALRPGRGADSADQHIAIVGYAGRLPGAPDVRTLWRNLIQGREGIRFFSDEELLAAGMQEAQLRDPNYVKAFGVLDDAEAFDAGYFGYSPREVAEMDPQHALMLECADAALSHAGYDPHAYPGRIGVFAGCAMPSYLYGRLAAGRYVGSVADMFELMLGHDKDFLTTRVSYKLNLRGPSVAVQTACSTSLVAVHLACQSLREGECEMALAGGVSLKFPQVQGYVYQEGSITSRDGHTRAFDARGSGINGGSGAGLVVLKRLRDALSDRDTVHAIIRGSAINNDGSNKVSYTAPSVARQAAVIEAALSDAGIDARSVTYVEAHGTATNLGDPIEVAALRDAFRSKTATPEALGPRQCAIGSIKSNLGHLNTAAGVAGLIKTVCALKTRQLPPSLHFEVPNPAIDFASGPFYVNDALTSWSVEERPLRAGVSSFGIGGTNAHLVLEEAPSPRSPSPSRAIQLLTISAKTALALERATADLADHLASEELDGGSATPLADIAYTTHVGRRAHAYRRAVVCESRDAGLAVLRDPSGRRVFTGEVDLSQTPRPVAFLFPGQGAQYPNMGCGLYRQEPEYRKWIDLGCELTAERFGLNLQALLYPALDARGAFPAASSLEDTAIAQPALFVVSIALAQLWMAWGVRPQAMLGHSIGEYAAACLAGVFSFEDALSLVVARGRLMSELPPGSMLAVSLSENELLLRLPKSCELAAINAPGLCVVSGESGAVAELQRKLSAHGVSCRALRTSHAFHSFMMEPALEGFRKAVRAVTLHEPRQRFLSNVTGDWISSDQARDPEYWVTHLRAPVRFASGLTALMTQASYALLEVGPGYTLGTLARQVCPKASPIIASLGAANEPAQDVNTVLSGLARLWLAGIEVDWHGFHCDEERSRVPLPAYPFERQKLWSDLSARVAHVERGEPRGTEKQADMASWFYTPVWKREVVAPQRKELGPETRWLILEDDFGIGAGLAHSLTEKGFEVVRARTGAGFTVDEAAFTISRDNEADYTALLGCLATAGKLPSAVVDLRGVREVPTCAPAASAGPHHYFYPLLWLARALAQRDEATTLIVISNGVADMTGHERVAPERALALGPCTVLPQEHPHIRCRHIDIELPGSASREASRGTAQVARLSRQLMTEVCAARAEPRVALRGSQCWRLAYEPLRLEADAKGRARLRQQGIYLITGGLGHVGRVVAEALARTVQAKLVLVGRSADAAASRDYVDVLEAAGAEVMTFRADVADPEQLRSAVFATVKRFGALHGVIHAAGGSREEDPTRSMIPRLDAASCAEQFRSKVDGVLALHEVLGGRDLDFVVLMSSLASVLGGLGFATYAGANAFMDAFVHLCASESSTPWLSVNWDAWRTGVASSTGFGSELARLSLTSDEGAEALLRILALAGSGQVIVSAGDLQARMEKWLGDAPQQRAPRAPEHTGARLPRPALSRPYVAPTNDIEIKIASIWQELLGFEHVGVHDEFIELGGHSLLATQVVSRLRETFGVELPIRAFVEAQTIAGLSFVVLQQQATRVSRNTLEALLDELERLPDDEVEGRLVDTSPDS